MDTAAPQPSAVRPRRQRRAPRAALACTFCRQRKARCSGDWPECAACARRQQKCHYPGHHLLAASRGHLVPDGLSGDDGIGGVNASCDASTSDVPSAKLRRLAIAFFREHYATTLLCFLPPQQLVEDATGDSLPPPLMLCILALRLLTASFIPAFASPGRSCSDVGDAYAARARRLLLVHLADDVSLARVQSCLVLALCDAGEGAEHSAWLLLGHAVRLAQFLHLHRQDAGNGVFDGGGDPLALSSTSGPPSSSATAHEAACRTLWACFCLERLLANGRDRIAALQREDITTRLPQSDEDFIYGRDSTSCTLLCSPDLSSPAGHSHRRESLFARTTRAVDILGRAVTWHGRGGRHRDARAPWHPDMPFAQLDAALRQWRAALPRHLAYSSGNACAAIACGDGRPWCFMMMVFFQVRVYIHRMYLPFTPRAGYDPADGPCNGPPLETAGIPPPRQFWLASANAAVESANAIAELYDLMRAHGLAPSTCMLYGLALVTAASIHAMVLVYRWPSLAALAPPALSRHCLQQDMDGFNDLGQHWSISVHWIRVVSLYYKLHYLTKRSWADTAYDMSVMNIRGIADGIMGSTRQMTQQDRAAARATSLKESFDFAGWLSVVEGSAVPTASASASAEAGVPATPSNLPLRLPSPPSLAPSPAPPSPLLSTANVALLPAINFSSMMPPWPDNIDDLAATLLHDDWILEG